jgi:hypothetical protein
LNLLSIAASLAAGGDKNYMAHVDPDGYEMGVGWAGRYDAHAHRGFTDIAFAPGGLRIETGAGMLEGRVHVTQPGHWFGPIEFHSDFWFVKFFESAERVCQVPDKIVDRASVSGAGTVVTDSIDEAFPLFQPGRGVRVVHLASDGPALIVAGLMSDGPPFEVRI